MNKALIREVVQIAERLPLVVELTHEKQKVKGSVLIWQGMRETLEGEKILPHIVYEQDFPVVMEINHKRRMIQAFKDGGEKKLLKYIDTVTEMYENQQLSTN